VAVANGKWQQFAQSDKLPTWHEKLMPMLWPFDGFATVQRKWNCHGTVLGISSNENKRGLTYSDHNFLSK
jgi:hypothetical protein